MFSKNKPKKVYENRDKNDVHGNTMFVTFQLNQDNPVTINLDYHYLGETVKANYVKQESLCEEAEDIEKAIKQYRQNCCTVLTNGRTCIQEVNFALLQKTSDTNSTILWQRGCNYVQANDALKLLVELETETKKVLGMEVKHKCCA